MIRVLHLAIIGVIYSVLCCVCPEVLLGDCLVVCRVLCVCLCAVVVDVVFMFSELSACVRAWCALFGAHSA
jgi:hypothetical protein